MSEFEIKPVKQKMIYVYKHPDTYRPHIGWLKIGDQTGLDSTRINDQNEADNIVTETLFQIPAIDIYGNTFRDYDIHKSLEFAGYRREPKVNNSDKKSEWFKVDLETVKKVIDDRINCRDFFKTYIPEPSNRQRPRVKLREEQEKAVKMTYDYWLDRAGNPDRDFLWNAKPRFGKTLTAYNFAMKIQAKRILIVTNRPAISDSWARDFYEHIRPEHPEYIFSSAKGGEVKTNDDKVYRIPSRSDILGRFDDLNRPLVFFISLQDIKGKSADSDDFKKKNQWIFEVKRWDLLIIDESHEGVKTSKTKEVLDKLGADFTLCLSGTPFKAIANNDFGRNQIYNWSYADEQESKANWDYEQGLNPYENLPKMNFRAYHMSTMMESKVDDEEACFDLSEFFKTSSGNFLRPGDVVNWLDKISGVSRDEATGETFLKPAEATANMPFDTDEKRENLRHTFWLLPGVAECRAMKDLLKIHPVFKDYEVVLAAGKGDDDQEGKKVLDRVRNAITNEPLKTKTITLSCGQLTTGITVPEWTAVFMLYGSTGTGQVVKTSSTQYLQAAFRAQNPWTYGEHKEFSKDDCYIFDFAPDRVLTILGDYAIKLTDNHREDQDHKPAIRKLLNYLSVISMDEKGEMRELDAKDVVELPRKLIAKEIVDGGFVTSNKLFNITNIFHATPEARQIINKLTAVKKQKLEKAKTDVAETETEVDEDGNTIIDPEVIVNSSEGVLRKKEYEVLTDEDKQIALQAAVLPDETPIPDSVPEEKREVIESAVEEIKQEAKKQKEKVRKKEEEEYRDKLRGFARTIPMLLHTYGQPGMTFDDLEKKIPDDIFFELTDITKDEFRILRKEQYFNEDNCTVAIKEFMKREEELADYFCIGAERDIFDYIPMQRNNQVFTPKKVIGEMLDMLEQENPGIFKSNRRKFIDLYSKSGLFLSEIVKRLYEAQRKDYASDRDCLMHILSEQIFAWSPNDILRKASINTVIGFTRFDRDNFDQKDKRNLERNFLNYDPINEKGEIDNGKVQQKIKDCWENNMKFDIIIGNPPYQISDGGGTGDSAKPIYQKFIQCGMALKPKYLCMITPSKWMIGGKGLDKFRREMMVDTRIKFIKDFNDASECFPNVHIDGGVNFFLWDYNYDGMCDYSYFVDGEEIRSLRYLKTPVSDFVIRDERQISIVEKSKSNTKVFFSSIVEARNYFGITTSLFNRPDEYPNANLSMEPYDGSVKIYGVKGKKGGARRVSGYVNGSSLDKNSMTRVDKYKLFFSKAYSANTTVPPDIIVGKPGEVCTETFLTIGDFTDEENCLNCLKYMKTRFFRILLTLNRNGMNNSRASFDLVPMQNFAPNSDIDWNKPVADIDQQLYKKYGLTAKEIKFIEEKVKAME